MATAADVAAAAEAEREIRDLRRQIAELIEAGEAAARRVTELTAANAELEAKLEASARTLGAVEGEVLRLEGHVDLFWARIDEIEDEARIQTEELTQQLARSRRRLRQAREQARLRQSELDAIRASRSYRLGRRMARILDVPRRLRRGGARGRR